MPRRQAIKDKGLLLIRIKKGKDGGGALSCERGDGSIVYQRQNAKQAGFFVRHDLTHFAVETVLGHRKGFFGLIAAGWSFEDFGEKWDKKKYPVDADPSELIVGLFDAENASRARWTAEEFNGYAGEFMRQQGVEIGPVITQEQVESVHEKIAELMKKWGEVEMGETMELEFGVG
ncbi:MAG TPA: hypothetical protein VGQ99_09720 [Tepidisphaeraceae bacterium]|nr:hypothetical protein [Tepidisphaeraceae bacterium]